MSIVITQIQAELFENIQFIYELTLARMELDAFGVQYSPSYDMRTFRLSNFSEATLDELRTRTAYFKEIAGVQTTYHQLTKKNRTRSVNQYLTHWIYPYKGKFHPQMIRALLNIIGLKPGQTLFEPFGGSGTAALEAQLLGINSTAVDVSPLCVIQARVKTESYLRFEQISQLKDHVLSATAGNLFTNGDKFKQWIERLTEDRIVVDFFTLARMLALSDEARRRRDYSTSFAKNINTMLLSVRDMRDANRELGFSFGSAETNIGDARSTGYPADSFDGIITSPPYSIALDYVENDAHALVDLGYDPQMVRESYIGVRGKGASRVTLFNNDMMQVFREMHRVLKPKRFAVIIIGNATYLSQEVDSIGFTIEGMSQVGFCLKNNVSKIIFGLYNVMKQENILIFVKQS